MKEVKYEYYVKIWGGFFNSHIKAMHGINEGDYWFNTSEERDDFIKKLYILCDDLKTRFDDAILVKRMAEGYHTRNIPKLHRIAEYNDMEIYSEYEWSFPCEEINVLKYHMEWKWYPGFNDYAIEEAFPDEEIDYEEVKILSEWITGAFNINEI